VLRVLAGGGSSGVVPAAGVAGGVAAGGCGGLIGAALAKSATPAPGCPAASGTVAVARTAVVGGLTEHALAVGVELFGEVTDALGQVGGEAGVVARGRGKVSKQRDLTYTGSLPTP
jgi:hypothetical protein